MIQIHTHTAEETAWVWHALLHVPDSIWRPVVIVEDGVSLYRVMREADGGQTSVPLAAPQAPAAQPQAA